MLLLAASLLGLLLIAGFLVWAAATTPAKRGTRSVDDPPMATDDPRDLIGPTRPMGGRRNTHFGGDRD